MQLAFNSKLRKKSSYYVNALNYLSTNFWSKLLLCLLNEIFTTFQFKQIFAQLKLIKIRTTTTNKRPHEKRDIPAQNGRLQQRSRTTRDMQHSLFLHQGKTLYQERGAGPRRGLEPWYPSGARIRRRGDRWSSRAEWSDNDNYETERCFCTHNLLFVSSSHWAQTNFSRVGFKF